MSVQAEFDAVVIGGGLVGAATALALRDSGLRLALVEAAAPPAPSQDDSWDSRIYAISPGNARFLASLNVWDALDPSRIAPIEAMQVQGDDGTSQLEFSAFDACVPCLGYIVESRLLQAALWERLRLSGEVELVCPARCHSLSWASEGAELRLQDGRALAARLVIGADGGHSWTRAQGGIGVRTSDYRQMGVVANFACELPHRNVARQWFRRDGILAWLPLPGNRMSMVWSTGTAHAQELLAHEPAALCAAVAAAGGGQLGALELLTPAAAFPLRLQNAETMVKPRLALVGDAAHLVHPLAGQGVNLGFHDAADLMRVLAERGPQSDVGAYGLLRRYERSRKADILAMQATTHGLQLLFGSELAGIGLLRNRGMDFFNRQQWLKRRLMAHAMT